MTPGWLTERDLGPVEALIADRYLEDLLAAGERRALTIPADAALDPAVRDAAAALRRAFVRVHPSFRFEERLAGRLAEFAVARATAGEADRPVVAGTPAAGGTPVVLPLLPAAVVERDGALLAIVGGELDPAADGSPEPRRGSVPRPVLVGGAMASAVLSIAGVAMVAWRAARPPVAPMARAARAVRGRRLAAVSQGRPA